MLSNLFKMVKPGSRSSSGADVQAQLPKQPVESLPVAEIDIRSVTYPPVDPGIPAIPWTAVLAAYQPVLDRLREVVGGQDDVFQSHYLAPIRALAAQVHALPASASEDYAGPGGLLRLCLDMALYCAQATGGRIFNPDLNVQDSHEHEPRWRYAAFLAGLVCEVCRPLALAQVIDESGEQWPKFTISLSDWLIQRGATRYFVQWVEGKTEVSAGGSEGTWLINKVIPEQSMAWLNAADVRIVRDMMSVALGQARPAESVVADTCLRVRERLMRVEAAQRPSRYGRLVVGSHLEHYLLDGMRTLVERRVWAFHGAGPLYYGSDGLYVEWPVAWPDVRRCLIEIGLPGIPMNGITIAEILGKAGVLLNTDSGDWIWPIVVSDLSTDVPIERKLALRFRDAACLIGFADVRPLSRPYSESLVVRVSPGAASSPEAAMEEKATTKAKGAPASSSSAESEIYASLPKVEKVFTDAPSTDAGGQDDQKLQAAPAPVHSTAEVRPKEVRQSSHTELAGHLESSVRQILKATQAELYGRFVRDYRQGRNEYICDASGNCVAVAKDYIDDLDLDFAGVVGDIERLHWLGRPEGAGRQARVGQIQFGDKVKMGFVINGDGVKALGFKGGK